MIGKITEHHYDQCTVPSFCIAYEVEDLNYIFLGRGYSSEEAKRNLISNIKKVCSTALSDLEEIEKTIK